MINIKNKAILAPLSEYTTAPFRKLCKKYGADLTIVPLVSATAIARNPKRVDRIDFNPEFDDGIQLFGARPTDFSAALKTLKNKFPTLTWVDINCGCPSNKVCESGGGSALLYAPKIVAEIISSIRDEIDMLSIKMRLAETREKTLEFVRTVCAEGIDFITIHGRTPQQKYSGKARWDEIRYVKELSEVPIVGNGDVKNRKEGLEKIKEGYCDAFMIGRAAMGNPCCFSNFKLHRKSDCLAILNEYIEICNEMNISNINDIRSKALQIIHGFNGSAKIRQKIGCCKTISQVKEILELHKTAS